MRFLGNNEFGFDTQSLGFPSIHTCHAIVFQSAAGVFGYHSMGGQVKQAWDVRATHFAEFVRVHQGGAIPQGTRLYGCAFVCAGGRYKGSAVDAKRLWKQELVDFASKLQHTGKISGYQINKSINFAQGGHTSAYVEYVINGEKCDVALRQWGDNEHLPPLTANNHRTDHMMMHPKKGPSVKDRVVENVNNMNLTSISKEKLR
jgi:hypothetical protein